METDVNRLIEEALSVVSEQAFFMKKAMVGQLVLTLIHVCRLFYNFFMNNIYHYCGDLMMPIVILGRMEPEGCSET